MALNEWRAKHAHLPASGLSRANKRWRCASHRETRLSRPDSGLGEIQLNEVAVETPWIKEYDASKGEGPTRWLKRFDTSNWGLIAARDAASGLAVR